MISPKISMAYFPKPVNRLTIHRKSGFIDIVKLKILGWAHYPGLFRWTQYNYKGPYKRGRPKNETRERDVMAESKVPVKELLAVKREERPMSQGMQWPPGAGKAKEPGPSLAAQKEYNSGLISAQWSLFSASHFHNHRKLICCFNHYIYSIL